MGSSIQLDKVGFKIPETDATFHKQTVADVLNRPNLKFPGAQPVSFARKHLRELERVDYYVAEKTDGIRCLLFLTEIYEPSGPREAQFLIDRKNDYYLVEKGYLHIPPPDPKGKQPFLLESWHKCTILDGELVRQKFKDGKEQLTYLIFDLIALDGQSITDRTYDIRIGKLQHLVFKPWQKFALQWPGEAQVQPFQLAFKDFQIGYGIVKLFKEIIPQLPHINDGLIFTCRETAYVAGTDQHILKWKPPHENTIDFRLQLGSFPMEEDDEGSYEDFDQKPEFELLVYHGNDGYRKFADLFLTGEEWEAMKKLNEPFDWRIIECWREADTGRWRPKLDDGAPRFRDDKDHANHISVVESVLESIEDAVSDQDLIAWQDRIRDAWKERAKHKEAAKRQQEAEQRRRHEAAKAQHAQQQHHAQRGPSADRTPSLKDDMKEEEDDGPQYVD